MVRWIARSLSGALLVTVVAMPASAQAEEDEDAGPLIDVPFIEFRRGGDWCC